MSNPWQKIRDRVSTRAALEGVVLFDRGIRALVDTQAEDSETDEHTTVNPHDQQTLQRDSLRQSFDSDALHIDTDMDILIDEEGVDAIDEGLAEGDDLDLELGDLDVELAGWAEPGGFEDFELTDLDADASEGEGGEFWSGSDDEAIANSIHALLDPVLPSWDEDDTMADTFDENDAEADILMGMLLAGMAEEVAHMRGPHDQIPASKGRRAARWNI